MLNLLLQPFCNVIYKLFSITTSRYSFRSWLILKLTKPSAGGFYAFSFGAEGHTNYSLWYSSEYESEPFELIFENGEATDFKGISSFRVHSSFESCFNYLLFYIVLVNTSKECLLMLFSNYEDVLVNYDFYVLVSS